jgi:60S ribosome subunit biogenesis protein NIP7
MLQFREINAEEASLIKDHLLSSLRLREFEKIIGPFKIIVAEGNWKEILLVSDKLFEVFQEFIDSRNPYSMGIHLGDIAKNKFKISLEGITLISEYCEEKTILSSAGEKKVLYGRNLTKVDVSFFPSQIQKNDMSILINGDGEVLALGKYLVNKEEIEKLEKNEIIIKNIMDKGWYLRKGK